MVVRALRRASASRKRDSRDSFFFLGSRLTSSSTFSTFSSVSSSVYESSTAPQTTLRRPLADNLPVPLEREPPAADGQANRERLGSRRRRSEEFPGQRHRPVGPWVLLNDLPASNIAGETDAMFVLTPPPRQADQFFAIFRNFEIESEEKFEKLTKIAVGGGQNERECARSERSRPTGAGPLKAGAFGDRAGRG